MLQLERTLTAVASNEAAQAAHVQDLETELAAARKVNEDNDTELGIWSKKAHRFAEALAAVMSGGHVTTEIVATAEEATVMVEQARATRRRREEASKARIAAA